MQLNPLALALSTAGGPRFNPTRLFLDASQGFWLDASDVSTLFQDSAGTTPVTALGDPVGRWLDKSGRGNHFVQTTSGARPVWGSWPLSAAIAGRVRNFLARSQEFNLTWSVNRVSVTANTTVAPDGTTTADTVTANGTAGAFWVRQLASATGTNTTSVYIRAGTQVFAQISYEGDTTSFVNFDVTNGAPVVGTSGGTATGSIVDAGNGWYRCISVNTTSVTGVTIGMVNAINSTRQQGTTLSTNYFLWGAQLETGSSATTYQRVGASSRSDVSEAGQPQVYFVSPNGVNDFLVSAANVDFSATDRMFVCAGGVVKTEVATLAQFMIEHTENAGSTNGAFEFSPMPSNGAIKLGNGRYRSRGTDIATATDPTSTAAPRVFVYSGLSVISTDTCVLRQNGVQVATSATDQGSGNYASALTYLFSRAGTSLFYSGNTYQIVAVGKTPTTSELKQTETFVAAKTKGSLA